MKTLIRASRARRRAALAMLCLVLCGCAGAEGAPTACQDIALYSWGFVSQASDQSNTAYQVLEYRMPADQAALVDEYVRAIQSEAGWTLSDSFGGSGYRAWALRAPDGGRWVYEWVEKEVDCPSCYGGSCPICHGTGTYRLYGQAVSCPRECTAC